MERVFLLVCFCVLLTIVHSQSCFSVQFVCGDGSCLSRQNNDNGVCDLRRDCSDGSDESRCGIGSCSDREYTCLNGNCISGGSVCDGQNDCGDNSDEQRCGTINLLGFILGITFGSLALGLGCPLCIILGILTCVGVAFHRHKKRERELRSKNVTITAGGLLGGTQQPTSVSSTVQYTAQEEQVKTVV